MEYSLTSTRNGKHIWNFNRRFFFRNNSKILLLIDIYYLLILRGRSQYFRLFLLHRDYLDIFAYLLELLVIVHLLFLESCSIVEICEEFPNFAHFIMEKICTPSEQFEFAFKRFLISRCREICLLLALIENRIEGCA